MLGTEDIAMNKTDITPVPHEAGSLDSHLFLFLMLLYLYVLCSVLSHSTLHLHCTEASKSLSKLLTDQSYESLQTGNSESLPYSYCLPNKLLTSWWDSKVIHNWPRTVWRLNHSFFIPCVSILPNRLLFSWHTFNFHAFRSFSHTLLWAFSMCPDFSRQSPTHPSNSAPSAKLSEPSHWHVFSHPPTFLQHPPIFTSFLLQLVWVVSFTWVET